LIAENDHQTHTIITTATLTRITARSAERGLERAVFGDKAS